jgi:hypothetical protein
MTPKEKAKELIEKYSPLVTTWDCYNDCPTEDKYILRDSKKCSLIAVDEIISLMIKFHGRHIENNLTEIGYWEEVKQEIKKRRHLWRL